METMVQEDTLTAQERELAHLFLRQTCSAMVGAVKGMSEAQWRFSPGPEQWSAADIADHAVCILDLVGGMRRETLAQAPKPPAGQDYRFVDSVIINQFPTRLQKFPAPPFVCPTGRFASAPEAVVALQKSYAKLLDFLDSTSDLREHALEAPPLKAITNGAYTMMDGYQWILAAAAHTERHTKQILEVKAEAGYPTF